MIAAGCRQSYRSRAMSKPPSSEWAVDKGRRRSLRVLLTVSVLLAGKTADGQDFEEEGKTLVVNAHGALVLLANAVAPGQVLMVTHKATQQKLSCRVVYIGPTQGAKTQVGVEFIEPSPGFWQIHFPPEDWKTRVT
jgi:hypothetical protein